MMASLIIEKGTHLNVKSMSMKSSWNQFKSCIFRGPYKLNLLIITIPTKWPFYIWWWHSATYCVKQLFSPQCYTLCYIVLYIVTLCYILWWHCATHCVKQLFSSGSFCGRNSPANGDTLPQYCFHKILPKSIQKRETQNKPLKCRYFSLKVLGGQIKAFLLTNYPPAWMAVT